MITDKDRETADYKSLIFVYGTLLSGEPNYPLLESGTLVGEAQTKSEFRMFTGGWFPYVQRSELEVVERFEDGTPSEEKFVGYSIQGEVYSIDSQTLARLDRLEGVPSHYQRHSINVTLADGSIRAVDIYLYYGDTSRMEEIPGGNWKNRT